MLRLIAIFTLVVAALAAPPNGYDELPPATSCDPRICKLPSCRCSSTDVPGGLDPKTIPQLVLLTFDDAVSVLNIKYYREILAGRKNPDSCPIGVTYFVSHEYTDYSQVHELWSEGQEIAMHSITHQSPTTYWQELSVDGHMRQFADQIDLVSTFANIPKSDIKGIRLPFLQLSGNNSFEMIKRAGLQYDCSWPTLTYIEPLGLWPYTLDYKSMQDCSIGPCPTASLPGVWVVPMIDWKDNSGTDCAMVDSCTDIPDTVDGLVEFMKNNFKRHYNGNRAPFGFYVHAAWFERNPVYFKAYLKFLDYLGSLNDVYMVSVQRALEWVQKPSPLSSLQSSWPKCQATHANTCKTGRSCALKKGEEIRYMTTCTSSCPAVYPWLGNPLGKE